MAPPVKKALLCNSPFSRATAPLETTIPSEVITLPDTNVWAHAGETVKVHKTIKPARNEVIQFREINVDTEYMSVPSDVERL
jgi:hypothetical protein